MFAVCKFMDSENVKTREMSVEKERRFSVFENGSIGGVHDHAIALENGKLSNKAEIGGGENLKHFCKICERRFACGRALGGHMRIHGDSDKSNLRVISTEADMNRWCEAPVRDGTDPSPDKKRTSDLAYALRTNRKRSWVLTDQSGAFLTGMLEDGRPTILVASSRACDECGKEFPSWKALLAHMKCSHSGNPEQILDAESGNGVAQIQLRPAAKGKRSKRLRCSDDCHSPAASGTQYNEEEDMANCLVMLAMAGKSSSFEKPTEVIQARNKFLDSSDKIDRIGKKYECRTCQRVFSSFQALGGHRASNHHYNCSAPSKIGNDSSCSEEEIVTGDEGLFTSEAYSLVLPEKKKWDQEVNNESAGKARLHQCSICERKFSSGQALGGHKRCHRTTSAAVVHCSQLQESVEQEKTSLPPHYRGQLLDLNLPAPCHDEQYEAEHSDKAEAPIPNNLVNNFFSEINCGKYLFPFYSQPWRKHNNLKDRFFSLPEQTQTHMNVVVGPDDEAESIKRGFG